MTLDFPMLKNTPADGFLSPTNIQDFSYPSSPNDKQPARSSSEQGILVDGNGSNHQCNLQEGISFRDEGNSSKQSYSRSLSWRKSAVRSLEIRAPESSGGRSKWAKTMRKRDRNPSSPEPSVSSPRKRFWRHLRVYLPGTTIYLPTIGTPIRGDVSVLNVTPSQRPKDLPLLPPPSEKHACRITLVLDLEETLVHVTQLEKYAGGADFSFSLRVKHVDEVFYVKKRPGVDAFLCAVSQWYEVVVFSGSGFLYVEEIVNRLDPNGFIAHRLYKEDCTLVGDYCVKDLSLLGRDLARVIIIDNSEACYAYQPENAIPIPTWISCESDCELARRLPILERSQFLPDVRNSRVYLQ